MSEEMIFGLPAKYLALFALVIQNSALILTMRYSRVNSSPENQYLTSTAVVLSEAIKSFLCLLLHLRERRQYTGSHGRQNSFDTQSAQHVSNTGLSGKIGQLAREIYGFESGFVKMIFPAALYTLQDNLQFIAASNLDPATHQVTYQAKILTTALFAVLLLKKRLSGLKWLALLLLTFGVAAVQIPKDDISPVVNGSTSAYRGSRFVGMLAISCACITSGLAGVYFEKVLKGGSTQNSSSGQSNTSPLSLWTRSLQLSTTSFGFAVGHAIWHDGYAIMDQGFFHGYSLTENPASVAAVVMQATCGLIVALVIKYADNILKGFATSMSVVLSTVASVWLFGFVITQYFVGGAALVIVATWIYGLPDAPKMNTSTSALIAKEYTDEEKGRRVSIGTGKRESISSRSSQLDTAMNNLKGSREAILAAKDPFNGHGLLF